MPIKFGTDGWRGVIGRDFTFANVEIAVQAIADYLNSLPPPSCQMLIGYDTRFLANRFAFRAAEVLAGNGFDVEILDRPYPTPYVSFEVKHRGMAGGLMVTASHNPPEYGGIKLKSDFGGSATPPIIRAMEKFLFRTPPRKGGPGSSARAGQIVVVQPHGGYFKQIETLIRFGLVEKSGLRVVTDSMHGTGGTILRDILQSHGVDCVAIRSTPDPLFGGIFPEPMDENLDALREAIQEQHADVGLATDGDSDRLGVMDASGKYVNTHQILALLTLYLLRDRGWKGKIAKTVAQSVLIERICRKFGLEFFTVPIGFKSITELMLQEDILIGGEESNGIGIKNHLPERDGILINLLVLEMLAASGKPLHWLVRDLWREFGECHFLRRDLHVPLEFGRQLVERLMEDPPSPFAGLELERTFTLDGTKLIFKDESWILFRQSGTEPLLRIYAEAGSSAQVQRMMAEGLKLAGY
jgi:phosphomannomutase